MPSPKYVFIPSHPDLGAPAPFLTNDEPTPMDEELAAFGDVTIIRLSDASRFTGQLWEKLPHDFKLPGVHSLKTGVLISRDEDPIHAHPSKS